MYERCLSEAERVLASHKEVIVPVRTVWREVVQQSKRQKFEVPSIGDFTAMLEADLRFEFVPAHKSVAETVGMPQDENDTEELELEKMGFFGQDGVKLKQLSFAEPEEEIQQDESMLDQEPSRPVHMSLRRNPPSMKRTPRTNAHESGRRPSIKPRKRLLRTRSKKSR